MCGCQPFYSNFIMLLIRKFSVFEKSNRFFVEFFHAIIRIRDNRWSSMYCLLNVVTNAFHSLSCKKTSENISAIFHDTNASAKFVEILLSLRKLLFSKIRKYIFISENNFQLIKFGVKYKVRSQIVLNILGNYRFML